MMDKPAEKVATTQAAKQFEANIDTNRFRQKRFAMFVDLLEQHYADKEKIRVLDIGGTEVYWSAVRAMWKHLPLEITIVNLGAKPADNPPYYIRAGDACDMSEYADNSFDIVHSNSVIEHVGHWSEMQQMAAEIRRIAPHYFIQTPNFWFPLEPHYRTLFFQWYPETMRAKMLMRKKRGFRGPEPTLDKAMENIQTVNLLSMSQMASLFQDGKIEREKIFGLTKSVIAVK